MRSTNPRRNCSTSFRTEQSGFRSKLEKPGFCWCLGTQIKFRHFILRNSRQAAGLLKPVRAFGCREQFGIEARTVAMSNVFSEKPVQKPGFSIVVRRDSTETARRELETQRRIEKPGFFPVSLNRQSVWVAVGLPCCENKVSFRLKGNSPKCCVRCRPVVRRISVWEAGAGHVESVGLAV